MMRNSASTIALAAALFLPGAALAQSAPASAWSEQKCARYKQAWTELLARRGKQGLSADFVERHEAFLASGCTARGDVCPRSAEELEAANILVILAMNAGTASTFLPFSCRGAAPAN